MTHIKNEDVPTALANLFISHGLPARMRSDNGAELIANAVADRREDALHRAGIAMAEWLL